MSPIQPDQQRKVSLAVATNSFWTTADIVVTFASTLLCSVIVARSLGPEHMGNYAYLLWLSAVLGNLGSLGMVSATLKYASEYMGQGRTEDANRIVGVCFRYQLVSALAVFAIGIGVLVPILKNDQLFAFVGVSAVVPSMLCAIASAMNMAREDFASNVQASLVSTSLNVIGVLASISFGWGLVGLASALLASRILDALVRFYILWRRSPDTIRAMFSWRAKAVLPDGLDRRLGRFRWQTTLLLLIETVVWSRSEMFFLERYSTISQVAYFSLSFNIVQQALKLPGILSWSTSASLMVERGRDPDSAARITATTLRYLSIFSFPMMLGLAALSGPVFHILYGTRYEDAVPEMAITALFCIPRSFLYIAQQTLMAADLQASLLRLTLGFAVLNVTLDLWLIPTGGAIGAAMANGVSQLAAIIGIWLFTCRRLKITFPFVSILRVLGASAVMAIFVFEITRLTDPWLSVVSALVIGPAIYAALIRFGRVLTRADRDRLLSIQSRIPQMFRRCYTWGIEVMAA